MQFSGKLVGDFFLFFVVVQAFFLLYCQEQILSSTRLLGALEDESLQLEYQITLKKMALDEQQSAYQVLECAQDLGLTSPIGVSK